MRELERIFILYQKGEYSFDDYANASSLEAKDSNKSWHTKDWKEKRELILKNECERCGSEAQPLVVQHHWHPDTILYIYNKILREYTHQFIRDKYGNDLSKVLEEDFMKHVECRKCCPKCASVSIRFYKKDKYWRCYKCNDIKFTPCDKTIHVATKKTWEETTIASAYRWWAKNNIQDLEQEYLQVEYNRELVEDEAIVEHFIKNQLYLNFWNTATYCKKCAFKADKHIINWKIRNPT